MSRKLNFYNHKRRYTKKFLQRGGDNEEYEYTVTAKTIEMKEALVGYLNRNGLGGSIIKEKKVTKITVSKKMKDEVEAELSDKKENLINYDFIKVGMCVMNCDYKVTSPISEMFDSDIFKRAGIKTPVVPSEYITTVKIQSDKIDMLKYVATRYKLDVKNSIGTPLSPLDDNKFKLLDSKDNIRSTYTLENVPTDEKGENLRNLEYELKSVDLKVNIETTQVVSENGQQQNSNDDKQKKKVNLRVETNSAGFNVLQTFATDNQLIISTQKEGLPFEQIIEKALKNPTEAPQPYDENKFNQLYKLLVDENEKMKVARVSLIEKPTELKDKIALYNLLLKIDSIVPPDNGNKTSFLIRRTYVACFFISIAELQKNPKSDLNPAVFNKTPAANFFKKLYDVEKSEGVIDAAGRLIPIISTLRDYYTGKNTISFDTNAAGEEALAQQRKDIETGIENEFAIMSAFIGTKSQQVATKVALLTGMATGLWALVSKIQQNPETSAMLMAGVAAAGPQAILAGGVIAAVAVSYYIFLKIQDKYAKYFILIRTMNEYMIVLNKIDRLVRLSMRISDRYKFDVNLKEIEAQLKMLFKRFDKMLNEDDVSSIEKTASDMAEIPPFGEAAAQAEAQAEKLANEAMASETIGNDTSTGTPSGTPSGIPSGGGFIGDIKKKIGSAVFKLTFDVEMWNQKLNDDVVKLNVYFTTAMTEFSMILNVIQMGLLTSDNPNDKTKLQTTNNLINNSTEYRKMVIGILLNDILKLRVDYSFCNRGGGLGGFTKTTDEGVCVDIENLGPDPVGNKRSKFKEKLHGHIEHLVKVLKDPTCPYPTEIKTRINKAVILPYIEMIKKAKPVWGPANTFYLTNDGKLTDDVIAKAQTDAVSELNLVGGGLFGKSLDIKPSSERDVKILKDLKGRAYDFVTHDALVNFLMGVDKFVKAENEPTVKEKEEAKEIANEITSNDTITKTASYDIAKEQPKLDALAAKNATLTGETWRNTYVAPDWTNDEADAQASTDEKKAAGQNPGTETGQTGTQSGGRRLTRKRSFKPKKNRRNTRGLKAFPFKSAAAALKAYHRK